MVNGAISPLPAGRVQRGCNWADCYSYQWLLGCRHWRSLRPFSQLVGQHVSFFLLTESRMSPLFCYEWPPIAVKAVSCKLPHQVNLLIPVMPWHKIPIAGLWKNVMLLAMDIGEDCWLLMVVCKLFISWWGWQICIASFQFKSDICECHFRPYPLLSVGLLKFPKELWRTYSSHVAWSYYRTWGVAIQHLLWKINDYFRYLHLTDIFRDGRLEDIIYTKRGWANYGTCSFTVI
jgi:hypothetical protein